MWQSTISSCNPLDGGSQIQIKDGQLGTIYHGKRVRTSIWKTLNGNILMMGVMHGPGADMRGILSSRKTSGLMRGARPNIEMQIQRNGSPRKLLMPLPSPLKKRLWKQHRLLHLSSHTAAISWGSASLVVHANFNTPR